MTVDNTHMIISLTDESEEVQSGRPPEQPVTILTRLTANSKYSKQ